MVDLVTGLTQEDYLLGTGQPNAATLSKWSVKAGNLGIMDNIMAKGLSIVPKTQVPRSKMTFAGSRAWMPHLIPIDGHADSHGLHMTKPNLVQLFYQVNQLASDLPSVRT